MKQPGSDCIACSTRSGSSSAEDLLQYAYKGYEMQKIT